MGLLYYISFTFLILLVRLGFCRVSAAVDYVIEGKAECHYLNGTQEVRYLQRYFYNQEEQVYFDSKEGKYIAKTEFGRPDADYWNSQKDLIDQRKAEVQTFCIHNYGVAETSGAIGRKVTPEVYVSLMPHDDPKSVQHMLVCNVYGFYPSGIVVKWYRNGREETEQVQSSELFHNGDWTCQILVMLETEMEKGDTFTCEVHHSSLKTPHRVDWHPEISESEKNKMVTGIFGFVLGAVFLIAGIVMYIKGQKAIRTSFRGPQSEHFLHT
ncbi:H-2 class II histocompatibility antigen, E-S beta chain-like [Leptodactylus fuscus]|uniref:H-2 class II histocompatibility antigen, E-S beta chain-like n=1 Tax=Leptodactylus fuscus TaxID=238119 RepID=UPI003F4E93B4